MKNKNKLQFFAMSNFKLLVVPVFLPLDRVGTALLVAMETKNVFISFIICYAPTYIIILFTKYTCKLRNDFRSIYSFRSRFLLNSFFIFIILITNILSLRHLIFCTPSWFLYAILVFGLLQLPVTTVPFVSG